MKTEDILLYDRMYRAMREVLDADVIAFGFWPPSSGRVANRDRTLHDSTPDADGRSAPYSRLSGDNSL